MKKIILSMMLALSVLTAFADKDVRFHMNSGEVKCIAQERVDSIFFDDAEEHLIIAFDNRMEYVAVAAVDSIKYAVLPQMVEVLYSGDGACVVNPFAFDSVAVNIDGAKVTVISQTTKEVDYRLQGVSDNGCFKIYGSRKYNLYLDGVSLTNSNGAAINSQCKKRARVFVNDGTENTLTDAAKYVTVSGEDEKGTLFSEGQIIFEGNGKLVVNALNKHAICSDDYIEVRGATIEVAKAAGDAVHVKDSVIVNGGNLLLNSQSDGIDCDGIVKLLGGKVEISTPGEDVKGVKSAQDIIIDGAELSVTIAGDASKGIKSSGNFSMLSGTVNVEATGNTVVFGGDPSYATCIKCDSTVTISGGTLSMKATGIAGRGISADCDVNITGGAITALCSGNSETYDPTYDEILGGEEEEEPKSYVVYVSVPTSTTSNRPGGSSNVWKNVYLYDSSNTLVATLTNKVVVNNTTFYSYDFGAEVTGTYYFKSDNYTSGRTTYTIQSSSFTGVSSDTYYQIASNYSTSGSTRTYTITDVTGSYAGGSSASSSEDSYAAAGIKCDKNFTLLGGSHTITMSGSESKGVKVEGTAVFDGGELTINTSGTAKVVAYDPSYCTAIKCDGALTINGGDIDITATGQGGMGISADGVLTMNGGNVDITLSGAGASYTATTGTDYYSTKCLKGDVAVNLLGGTLNCLAKGNGSKAIVASGELTIGREGADNALLNISAVTQGSSLGSTSGGGGGGFPGGGGMGGMNSGFNAAPKAIKGAANVYVNSGTVYAETKNDGGEGLESKATLTINGGIIECSTYDDGINAKSALVINGGYIYSHATNNDGIDSNGTITINGGIALSSGTSSPEEGFDCDQNKFVINGGVMVGTGGATSNPTSATQPYSSVTSVSVTSGKYIAVKNSSGTVLFSYKCPNTVSSATVLLSSPEFTKTSHTLMYGVTSVSDATETLFGGVYSVGGVLSGGSSKTFTPQTK
ncbi:MAG: carbohydrate-binding domain-containing protein [Bacteroidaceae bacterium]|nr:carbohydrate-binding domain-containing protein [Bacteroidaceae bacterium]